MALAGWILDKSASARIAVPPLVPELDGLMGKLYICPTGALERLYSARSAADYDWLAEDLAATFPRAPAPIDLVDRALVLQRDLAHHHGMWHRVPIPDLLIAETALHNGLGVLHVDRDFERIAEVRPLTVRRLSRS